MKAWLRQDMAVGYPCPHHGPPFQSPALAVSAPAAFSASVPTTAIGDILSSSLAWPGWTVGYIIVSPSHTMPDVSTHHQPDLAHHVHQGKAWLSASAEGENTAALSYAAFELRFAVERLAIHYWAALLDRKPEEHDLRDIESFKRVERRIYELGGHQGEIDGHFAFMRIVLCAMRIDMPFHTPKIGSLSKYWHECSELCHIAWPLSCAVPELRKAAYSALAEIAEALAVHVQSLGWPVLRDAAFANLRDKFIAGDATADDVLAHVQRTGLWAKAEFTDGRAAQFVGEPVPLIEPETTR